MTFKNLKALSTILILYGFTAYTLVLVDITNVSLDRQHYLSIFLLWVATVCYFFKYPVGHLVTGSILIVGLFMPAFFTPTKYYLIFGFLTMSMPYFFLLVWYLIVNFNQIGDWLIIAFNGKLPESDILDEMERKQE